MPWNKEDRSFKTLINKETTDSNNKFYFNELGADTINVHAQDIWAEVIPFNDPAQAVLLGRAAEHTLFELTEDLTVLDHQSWKAENPPGTRLKDWISDKYGSDFNVRLFDGSDSEIFTTDPLDWFFDYQTGILTFNGTLTRPTPLKITGYRYIGIKGISSGGVATETSLIIPVDYEALDSADPPSDVIFTTQDVVNDTLALLGASAFKHLQAVWDALPVIIRHPVNIQCAAGIHRPRPADVTAGRRYVWTLDNKFTTPKSAVSVSDVLITITGVLGSEYEEIVSSATVSAVGADDNDPYIDFTGTPFAGIDLRGLYLILDTGQIATIHSHTDSRLYLLQKVSPASPTSGFVGRPGTIIRNSYAGSESTYVMSSGVIYSNVGNLISALRMEHLTLEQTNRTWSFNFTNGWWNNTNICVDAAGQHDAFGVATSNVRGWQYSFGRLALYHCSFRGGGIANSPIANTDEPIFASQANALFNAYSYFGGSEDGIYTSRSEQVIAYRSVYDELGYAFWLQDYCGFVCQDGIYNNTGKRATVRNCVKGIKFGVGGIIDAYSDRLFYFEGITDACVEIGDNARYVPSSGGFKDGGGNTGVGFKIVGSDSLVKILSGDTITGAGGDLEFSSASEVWSYTEIETYGPIIDEILGNRVSK